MIQSPCSILGIIAAFTIDHSLTLSLAALGAVTVSSRPVEVLIAVSVLISALHAFLPIFPGKEALIAAFFGLIHGWLSLRLWTVWAWHAGSASQVFCRSTWGMRRCNCLLSPASFRRWY